MDIDWEHPDHKVLEVHEAYLKLLGTSKEEIMFGNLVYKIHSEYDKMMSSGNLLSKI